MSEIRIREFRRSDRDQLTRLVNSHVAAVIPGSGLSVNAVLGQLEREPGEVIVDPWVAERVAVVAEQQESVVAAALLHRYRADSGVGDVYRDTGEIRWLVFRPEAPLGNPHWRGGARAAALLVDACLDRMSAWGVTAVHADGALPAPGVYGVPDQWPHVARLYRESGFVPAADTDEVVWMFDLSTLPDVDDAPVAGMQPVRVVGVNGTRITAMVGGMELGRIEVEERDAGERRSGAPVADVGDLAVDEDHRRAGVGRWLVRTAARWLRSGGVGRLLAYSDPADIVAGAFLSACGFVELTRTRRGWMLDGTQLARRHG